MRRWYDGMMERKADRQRYHIPVCAWQLYTCARARHPSPMHQPPPQKSTGQGGIAAPRLRSSAFRSAVASFRGGRFPVPPGRRARRSAAAHCVRTAYRSLLASPLPHFRSPTPFKHWLTHTLTQHARSPTRGHPLPPLHLLLGGDPARTRTGIPVRDGPHCCSYSAAGDEGRSGGQGGREGQGQGEEGGGMVDRGTYWTGE